MGRLNDYMPKCGEFFKALWEKWDDDTETYEDPVEITFKQNDEGIQGVSSGGKSTYTDQYSSGRRTQKTKLNIRVTQHYEFGIRDRIRIPDLDESYQVSEIYENFKSPNIISNLAFPKRRANKTKVLVLNKE